MENSKQLVLIDERKYNMTSSYKLNMICFKCGEITDFLKNEEPAL